mgnify:CR=1 FL=1
MSKENARFASYVTQVAFTLSVSRNMVFVLDAIARGNLAGANMRSAGMIDTAVPSMRRLQERGLVHATDPNWPGRCQLTEAGKHVHALLVIAGLATKPVANEAAA